MQTNNTLKDQFKFLYHVGKKLYQVISLITLSNLDLFCLVLAHVYFDKFPIMCVFHILYEVENREPA